MTITCKTISIRPTIQDLFWFEKIIESYRSLAAISEDHSVISLVFREFAKQSIKQIEIDSDYAITEENLHQLRPDLIEYADLEKQKIISKDILVYNPFSTSDEVNFIFNSLEEFRQADQKLFDSLGGRLDELLIKTNNKFIQKVYDESGNFLENGLSNRE